MGLLYFSGLYCGLFFVCFIMTASLCACFIVSGYLGYRGKGFFGFNFLCGIESRKRINMGSYVFRGEVEDHVA